jgi:hypothetical protein
MNTPAHLIFGTAAFAKPDRPYVTTAAIAGALLPDLSLYLLVGWAMLIQGIDARIIFDELYFSPAWQGIFAVDNSIPLWGAVLALALWLRAPILMAFAGAGLLHVVFDLALHHDDARRHFWPLSDWVFQSPVSYWDGDHYGNIAGPLEIAVSLALCVVLWRRFRSILARALIVTAALAEAAPGILFAVMFAGK